MRPVTGGQATESSMNDRPDKKTEPEENSAAGRGVSRLKERQTRQARSLRDNLKKRKQQVRSRDDKDDQQQ